MSRGAVHVCSTHAWVCVAFWAIVFESCRPDQASRCPPQTIQIFTLGASNGRGLFFPSGFNASAALNGSSERIGLDVPPFIVNVSPMSLKSRDPPHKSLLWQLEPKRGLVVMSFSLGNDARLCPACMVILGGLTLLGWARQAMSAQRRHVKHL